ncbi:MAG: O-antigen ligase family protein [Magnetococcales bacterium]|nr:O-antigen ligase family protein [Magnetococcales bacterium]
MTVAFPAHPWAVRSFLLLGVSLPFSTSLTTISSYATLVLLLLSGGWRERRAAFGASRVAWALLLLFALLGLGVFYGELTLAEAGRVFWKYHYLLLAVLLLPFFADERVRMLGVRLFLVAMSGVVALSVIAQVWAGRVHPDSVFYPLLRPDNPGLLKSYISTSLMMSFYVFVLAHHAFRFRQGRWVGVALAGLGMQYILYFSPGRSGYVLLMVLLFVFAAQVTPRRYLLPVFAAVGAVLVVVLSTSATIQQRLDAAVLDYRLMQDKSHENSIGARYDYFVNGLALIREKPVAGGGTGSVLVRYTRLQQSRVAQEGLQPPVAPGAVRASTTQPTSNLHNQYLEFGVQVGLMGVMALVWVWVAQWQASCKQDGFFRDLSQGFVVLFAVGCLINSMLMDFTERYFFTYFTVVLFANTVEAKEASP